MNTTNLPMAAAVPNTEESPRINPFVVRMNEYNDRSLARSEKLPYMKYFIEARRTCFPHIKFNFMGYFLKLTTKEELFCVPHEKLIEYGVITTQKKSSNIKRCLDQYGLVEGEDFTMLNVEHRGRTGSTMRNIYILTQDAFKLCLMRAKNSREFANYYLMLEKVIGFQQKYLDMYNERMMNFKNDQIERLERMMNELTEVTRGAREEARGAREEARGARQETQLTREENAGLRDDVQDLLDEISGVRVELREVRDQNETIQHTVDLIVEDRNVRPENPVLGHEFLLTKLDDQNDGTIRFSVMRGQRSRVSRFIDGLPDKTAIIIHQRLEPNPIDAYNRLKEEINEIHRIDEDEINDREDLTRREKGRLIREYRRSPSIDYKNNLITIRQNNGMTEERFITMVQDILNEKYEVDNLVQE